MHLTHLPFSAPLEDYQQQAAELLQAHATADPQAIQVIHEKHPRFLDKDIPWLPLHLTDAEIERSVFDLSDAQLTIARWYDFQDWNALAAYAASVADPDSPVFQFEAAVEAVIHGDLPALESLLTKHPDLVRARSTRVTHFDPPVHGATLLHYIAANGVEGYRQKTPPNALEIAATLLAHGAAPDALATMYGGESATMSMLVSSSPPADAGLQAPLVELLLDHGASPEAQGAGPWSSPLMTALAFGFSAAAQALVNRGAKVENIAAAAGLGRFDQTRQLLPASDAEGRHRALALAAQLGHTAIVQLLLDAGEDPNRYNPPKLHAHSTPLHQAVCAGHEAVVRLLVERGARLDMEDTIYKATPLGWANYLNQTAIAAYLGSISNHHP